MNTSRMRPPDRDRILELRLRAAGLRLALVLAHSGSRDMPRRRLVSTIDGGPPGDQSGDPGKLERSSSQVRLSSLKRTRARDARAVACGKVGSPARLSQLESSRVTCGARQHAKCSWPFLTGKLGDTETATTPPPVGPFGGWRCGYDKRDIERCIRVGTSHRTAHDLITGNRAIHVLLRNPCMSCGRSRSCA
jgi:hypothetical protein